MGGPAAPPSHSVRPQAAANTAARRKKGELVHVKGTGVEVRRPGSMAWEPVPADGMTMHQGGAVRVKKDGSGTVESESRGVQAIKPGTLAELPQLQRRDLPPALGARPSRYRSRVVK